MTTAPDFRTPESAPPPSPEDLKTAAEVRSRVEPIAAHPLLLEVSARQGVVTLGGPVFEHEVQRIVEAARGAPEVRSVSQRFEILPQGEQHSSSHPRGESSFGYRPDFISGHWGPGLRVAAGAAGSLMLARGRQLGGATGFVAAGVGTLLLARAITNRDVTHLIGAVVLPVVSLRRTILISASIEEVYEFWAEFANYPRFMSFVRDVQVNETGGLRWTARGPLSAHVYWDTDVLDLVRNQRITWKSVPGSLIATEGKVEFEDAGQGSVRLRIELSFAPPAGAPGYAIAHLLGFDPSERIDEDLEVMKLLIERRSRRAG